jgi:hypothetical protein
MRWHSAKVVGEARFHGGRGTGRNVAGNRADGRPLLQNSYLVFNQLVDGHAAPDGGDLFLYSAPAHRLDAGIGLFFLFCSCKLGYPVIPPLALSQSPAFSLWTKSRSDGLW